MFLCISEYFLHTSKGFTEWHESYPTFKWIWVLYVPSSQPHAQVFTIAGLRSLSGNLDRPILQLPVFVDGLAEGVSGLLALIG